MVTAEESDQCTVTLAIGTTSFNLTPQEAIHAGFELISLGMDADEHDREQQALALAEAAAQPVDRFDVDTTWWCRLDGCNLVFPSKSEAEAHRSKEHAA